jgi:hypothetical protein
MNKRTNFDDILNECLERLLRGESIEDCLSRYPEQAAELEPLLRTAQETHLAASIKPSAEFRQRAGYQFQAAIRDMETGKSRGFLSWIPRWATVVSIVVIVLIAVSGTVAASANSLPGQPLYQVKLATESVRLAFTMSTLGKAELNAQFANERINEIVQIAGEGNVALIDQTTERMNRQLVAVVNFSAPTEAKSGGEAAFQAVQAPEAKSMTPPLMAVPAPTPAPTNVPASTQAPSPNSTIATPPPQTVSTNLTSGEEEGPVGVLRHGAGENMTSEYNDVDMQNNQGRNSKQEDLKNKLTEEYYANLQALRDELEKAPDSVKPALQHAIEVAEGAYNAALSNLGY